MNVIDAEKRKRELALRESLEDHHYRTMIVPVHIRAGIMGYILDHVGTGDFLTAVFQNNLYKATMHADDSNRKNLPAIVNWVYTKAPFGCRGSMDKNKNWLALRKVRGD